MAMRRQSTKRLRTDHINTDDSMLSLLLLGRATNSSFSDLYRKSQDIGWLDSLIEERSRLKFDQKSKSKRLILNRWISECSQNSTELETKIHEFNEKVKYQMFNTLALSQENINTLPTIESTYAIIEQWKQRQCQRRLFDRPCDDLYSFLGLQQIMTNRFLELINLLHHDSNSMNMDVHEAFIELFRYSIVIVSQPSGTDCVAATKYERVGKDNLAKIKTRIICLLDLNKIQQYLHYTDIDLILYPTDHRIDPHGDQQKSIPWKIRKIITDKNQEQTFFYAELTENDFIYLRRVDSKGRLLYNNKLCQLEFRLTLRVPQYNIETVLVVHSQSFGLCSHAKYYSKYLAKVFIEELNQWQTHINAETDIHVLKGYIGQFYKRMTGVEAKRHTLEIIEQALIIVYNSFQNATQLFVAPLSDNPWDMYQDILEKLFVQIKFLSANPFLAMMYDDSLFYGISNDEIDSLLVGGAQQGIQMAMRLESFQRQEPIEYPQLIFAFHDGVLRRARTSQEYMVDDILKCIDDAMNNGGNNRQVCGGDQIVSFHFFQLYHDKDLNRDNHIQADEQIIFYPLRILLENTI